MNAHDENRGVPRGGKRTANVFRTVLYTDVYLTRSDLGISGECARFAELVEAVEDYLIAEA